MNSRTICCFILSYFMLLSFTFAQDSLAIKNHRKNALLVQVEENFHVSDFQGSALSWMHHKSLKTAYRVGMEYYFNQWQDGPSDKIYSSPSIKSVNKNLQIQIIGHIIKFHGQGNFKFYYGLGPMVGFAYNLDKQQKDQLQLQNLSDIDFTVGISLIYGIRAFIYDNISILIEYGQQGFVQLNRDQDLRNGVSESTLYQISSIPIKIGVAFYY